MKTLCTLFALPLLAGTLAAQTPSPCSLVTLDELKQVAGAGVTEGKVNANNKSVCDYMIGSGVLNISLVPKTAADNAARTVAELAKRNIKAEVVSGFGDSAYLSSPAAGMQQIGVYKGNSQVLVTAMILSGPAGKAKELVQAVVKKALPRVR